MLFLLEYCSSSSHLCFDDFSSLLSSLTALVSSLSQVIKVLVVPAFSDTDKEPGSDARSSEEGMFDSKTPRTFSVI